MWRKLTNLTFTVTPLDIPSNLSLHSFSSERPEITVGMGRPRGKAHEPKRFWRKAIYQDVQKLSQMTVGELRDRYLEGFGEEPAPNAR